MQVQKSVKVTGVLIPRQALVYLLKRSYKWVFGTRNKHVLLLLQVELFADAVKSKALDAGWQALSQEQVSAPDAYQLYVSAT